MKFFHRSFLLFFYLFFFCPTLKAEVSLKLLAGEIVLKNNNIVYKNAQLNLQTEAGSWNMKAERIFHFPKQKKILLQGAVEIQNQSLKITAEEMEADTKTGFFKIENGLIQDVKNQLEIQASKIQQKETAVYELENAFFTSCQIGEKTNEKTAGEVSEKTNKTWEIFFQKTTYRVDNFASGRHSLFYLRKIPILYFPIFAWPTVLGRKSGVLPPSFSYRAGDSENEYGLRLQIPYFFNLSPHTDYTLTLDYLQTRGLGLDNELHNLGKKNRETEFRFWYLKESVQPREEAFFPQRYFASLFHRNHFLKNGDIFIESAKQSDSEVKENYFTDKTYPLNSSQAREDNIQLGYHWKGGKITMETQRNFDFITKENKLAGSRLDTDFSERKYLKTSFQQSHFFAPYFEIDFQSQWEMFASDDAFLSGQEGVVLGSWTGKSWTGERLTTRLKNQLVLGNSYFFFYPSLEFVRKNYQANDTSTDTDLNFSVETYPSFVLDTGLNFEKFNKTGKWRFQPKISYQKIPQQNTKELLADPTKDNYYAVKGDTLFDSHDTILAKNIAQFSLLWDFQKHRKTEKQFFLELSVVYDLDPNHTTEDIESRNGSYIPPIERENALSLEKAIMPIHLKTKWLATKNLHFSYFTRYDSHARKDLEHLFQARYSKNRNSFTASFHKNIRDYTNFNNEDFHKKNELTISIKKSLGKYWSSSLLLERNSLIDQKRYPFKSQVIGKGIDKITFGFVYNDCCTIAKISLYEKVILATEPENSTLDRGISLDFQLKNQF